MVRLVTLGLSFIMIFSPLKGKADMLDFYMMGVLPSIAKGQNRVITTAYTSDYGVGIENYHQTAVNFSHLLSEYMQINLEIAGIASSNFTQTIDSYEMNVNDLEQISQKLAINLPRMAALLLYIDQLNTLEALMPTQSATVLNSRSDARIAFTTVAFLIGITYGLASGAKSTYNHVQEYNQIGEYAIQNANPAELKKINQLLSLPENATKQEASAKYGSYSFVKKGNLVNNFSKINAEVGDGDLIVKARGSYANLSKALGKDAVVTTVGTEVSVIGGQGVDKVATALGASKNAAAAIDLAVTVTQTQPLDIVVMVTESKDKTAQRITDVSISHQDALALLEKLRKNENIPIENAIEAAGRIAYDTSKKVPGAQINSDNSIDAPVSDLGDIRILDRLSDFVTLKIRDIENFNLLFLAQDAMPKEYLNLFNTQTNQLSLSVPKITASARFGLKPATECITESAHPVPAETSICPQSLQAYEEAALSPVYGDPNAYATGSFNRNINGEEITISCSYQSGFLSDEYHYFYDTTYEVTGNQNTLRRSYEAHYDASTGSFSNESRYIRDRIPNTTSQMYNGLMIGKGTYFNTIRNYLNNQKEGADELFTLEGCLKYSTEYLNDAENGKALEYYDNSAQITWEKHYKNQVEYENNLYGIVRNYTENGYLRLEIDDVKNNLIDGIARVYYENTDQINVEATYSNGVIQSQKCFAEDGSQRYGCQEWICSLNWIHDAANMPPPPEESKCNW